MSIDGTCAHLHNNTCTQHTQEGWGREKDDDDHDDEDNKAMRNLVVV